MKDIITIRGDRELWLEFIYKIKREKRRAWDVLSPFLRKYCLVNEDTRILLMLFPKSLFDKLLNQESPEKFVEEAIREHLLVKK
jgi:hypothetical protein